MNRDTMKMNQFWQVAAVVLLNAVFVSANAAEGGALSVLLKTFDQRIAALSAEVASLEKITVGASNDDHSKVEAEACLAVATGNFCSGSPSGAKGPLDPMREWSCQNLHLRLIQSKILMTAKSDPEIAKRLCMAVLKTQPGMASNLSQLCDDYVRFADDARKRTEMIWPLLPKQSTAQDSPAAMEIRERGLMGRGTAASCQELHKKYGWGMRTACNTARAYRAAFMAKDAKLCGSSDLCRALMGQPAEISCRGYLERARTELPPNQFREKLSQTEFKLMALLPELDSIEPKKLASVMARRKSVSALQARCVVLMRRVSGSKPTNDAAQGR